MNFRRGSVVGVIAALILLAACGGSGDGSTSPTSPPTTTLPLQGKTLKVGGDVQGRATDVISVRISQAPAWSMWSTDSA